MTGDAVDATEDAASAVAEGASEMTSDAVNATKDAASAVAEGASNMVDDAASSDMMDKAKAMANDIDMDAAKEKATDLMDKMQ